MKELVGLRASISELSKQICNGQATLNALTLKNAAASNHSFKLPLSLVLEMDELEESFEDENIKTAMVCIESFTFSKFKNFWITWIFDVSVLLKNRLK